MCRAAGGDYRGAMSKLIVSRIFPRKPTLIERIGCLFGRHNVQWSGMPPCKCCWCWTQVDVKCRNLGCSRILTDRDKPTAYNGGFLCRDCYIGQWLSTAAFFPYDEAAITNFIQAELLSRFELSELIEAAAANPKISKRLKDAIEQHEVRMLLL